MSTQSPRSMMRMERLSRGLSGLIDRFQPAPTFVLLVTALVVGVLTGIGAIIFRYLISAVSWIGYVWFPSVAVRRLFSSSPQITA